MSTIVRAGNLQFTAAAISQGIARSSLLPQLLRSLIIEETLVQWQSSDSTAAQLDSTSKLQLFKQANWGHKLGSYYLTRKSQLDRVIYSIVQVEDGSLAQEIFFRIQSGEQTFIKLAMKYSQGVTALDGGYSGIVPLSRLHPLVANQLARMAPSELSPLFTIGRFYTLLRLERLVPTPFDDRLRQLLLDELFEQWLQAKIASHIGKTAISNDLN